MSGRHTNMEKYIGKKYNRLLIKNLEFDFYLYKGKNIKRTYFVCKCDCGNQKRIFSGNILNGVIFSCGCYRDEIKRRSKNEMWKKLKPFSIFDSYYKNYKRGALKRSFIFELSLNEFIKIIKNKCFYCGSNPSKKHYNKNRNRYETVNGIDRIDSSKGYERNNIVTCCKNCNYFKNVLSVKEFLEHVKKIYLYQKIK